MIRKGTTGNSSVLWAARLSLAALIYTLPAAGPWSSVGWTQEARDELNSRVRHRTQTTKRPRGHAAAVPAPPKSAPVAPPESDAAPAGTLSAALAACDKASDSPELITLPGAKGEVKLDRCYRGRDHLVCSVNALLREAKTLFDDYGKIVDSNYPNVSSVDGVCGIQPDDLAADLKNAGAFEARFKVLKAEYGTRAACATKVEQSLRDVTLPDMVRAPDILKSMIDSIGADMKDVSSVQKQVLDLAEKVDSSQKAMVTIRKIHRTMCAREAGGQRTNSAGNDARK